MSFAGLREELQKREREKNQVKVAIAGAGFMGRGLINQLAVMAGVQVVAVATSKIKEVGKLLEELGAGQVSYCRNSKEVHKAEERVVLIQEPLLLAESRADLVVDCTGDPELGAGLALACLSAGKHFVANPEMDVTLGPVLCRLAREAKVVYSGASGDEPGEIMELYNYVRLLGFKVIAAGKFKTYFDVKATPVATIKWSHRYGQNPYRLASFLDGSKMNIEMALVANATGLVPDQRGMHCPRARKEELLELLQLQRDGGILNRLGVVEVVLGAEPGGAVFVIASTEVPQIRLDLEYLRMGPGPHYLFYRPYHLCAVEMGISLARVVLYQEAVITPGRQQIADAVAHAKRDLVPGETLDMIGGYTFYGKIETCASIREQNLLPASLAGGARVVKEIKQGEPITKDHVEIQEDRITWQLYFLQENEAKKDKEEKREN